MWIKSPIIVAKHGFSTVHGGISSGPFTSLNLGGLDDDQNLINTNRRLALAQLEMDVERLARLKQVHGNTVATVKEPVIETGDALVTNIPDLALAISVADCYPVLFHDPVNNVIGAAHAGWRGTVSRIVANTVKSMVALGAEVSQIKVAIGQGICQQNFEVGEEVVQQFIEAGFSKDIFNQEKTHIDLALSNKLVAMGSGIKEENIWILNRCTFENDFFSYRRDKGLTGRMWGVIQL